MFWKITFHEVATCFAMSIFFSIFRGHYLHDSSNSTSVCGLNIIWPFGDDRRAITNYNNNLIFAKNNWFWFLGHIFRVSLGVVYFCIADLTALIFEVRTERRGGRSDISGLQNILLGNCWGYAWIVSIIQTLDSVVGDRKHQKQQTAFADSWNTYKTDTCQYFTPIMDKIVI